MMGQKRKLVPTKWSITATDDIISKSLTGEVLDYNLIDSCKVFSYEHLGNSFSVVLFPHRWIYEMIEAWYSNGILGFGSDHEDARGVLIMRMHVVFITLLPLLVRILQPNWGSWSI